MITGYIYYSDGTRKVVAQSTGNDDEGIRKHVEQSTARKFEFALKSTPKWSSIRPTHYDVQKTN